MIVRMARMRCVLFGMKTEPSASIWAISLGSGRLGVLGGVVVLAFVCERAECKERKDYGCDNHSGRAMSPGKKHTCDPAENEGNDHGKDRPGVSGRNPILNSECQRRAE